MHHLLAVMQLHLAAFSSGVLKRSEHNKTSYFFCQQSSADGIYIARHVGLRVGVPVPVPALTVNRLCGSGFQSIANGCQVQSSSFLICISYNLYQSVNIREVCRNMFFVFGVSLNMDF